MADTWPWLALAGLGAFHGLNPAMGWLFAVALGLHRNSRRVVLVSLAPIALGHALSIWIVASAVVALGVAVDLLFLQLGASLILLGWAAYHWLYGHRHRVRVGLTAGFAGLFAWSFLMASAHGAGLMLVPALLPLCVANPGMADTLWTAGAAAGLHAAAMLLVTGLVAVLVYGWVGVAILRKGWINFDRIWSAMLVAAAVLLLVI